MTAASIYLMVLSLVAAPQKPQTAGDSLSDSKVIAQFQARVDAYSALHKKAETTTKPLPTRATAEQIDLVQRQLSERIVAGRARAKVGDIFAPETQAYFHRMLRKVFSGPQGADLRASILDENPIGTPVRVNGPYPDTIPLSTTPPQVIEVLPKLPDELEYRFVGDRLLLFDHHAHLIVDYLDHALPGV